MMKLSAPFALGLYNFIPKFFEDWPMNPACKNCDGNKDSLSSSISVVTSTPFTMVSHWTPITPNFFQNPGYFIGSHNLAFEKVV